MKRLFTISIILLLVISCGQSKKSSSTIQEPQEDVYTIHPSYTKLTYDAEIHFFGTDHKGRFKIEKDHFSDKTFCVLTSEESMKIFEASFDSEKNFKLEYIDDDFKGKKVEEILESDLQMLFKHTVQNSTPLYYTTSSDTIHLQQYNIDKHHYKYFYHVNTKYVHRIESSGLIGKDSYINLVQRDNGHPKEIDIHHPKIGLRFYFVHR